MPERPDREIVSPAPAARRWHFLQECSGACGDLGTFIPHVIGAITVAGLGAAGVLFGFGVFLVSSGLFYGLPVPVQTMKAVSAVILTNGLRPGEIAAAGLLMGALLFALGVTGAIGRVARFIPQSVSAGLQLGLGILMGVLGIGLVLKTPWLGFGALALLLVLMRVPRCPAAPLMLVIVTLAGWSLAEISLPGGLQAQYRFGARTGLAPMLFGGVLLVIGLGFAESAGQLFAIIPIGAVGALLIIAGTDLALSRRLFDGRPSCWPVIGITALLTVVANPAVGLAGGWLAELCRSAIVRTIARRFS